MDHHIQIEQLDDNHDQSSYRSYTSKDSIEIGPQTNINQHPYPLRSNCAPFTSTAADIRTTTARRRRRGPKVNRAGAKGDKGNIYRFFHSETGRLVCAFIYFFVTCMFMAFCNQLSDNRWVETNYTKVLLSDRGFDVIAAQADIRPANNFVMTSIVFTVLGIGLICPDWTTRAMVVRRIMWVIGTLGAYRSLTLSVTTLPTPKEECRPSLKTGFWDMFIIALQMIPGTVEACTDDIFSGHTVFMVTCAIQWRLYCKNKWVTYFAYLYISIGLYFVVATRLHYTVDVILAIFITYAVWSIYISMIEVVMEEEYFGVKSHHEKYSTFDNSVAEYEFSQEELDCAETEGDEGVYTIRGSTLLQRRRQLEHALNRLRGPRIGYGRGEYDRVAFIPMQFNVWLKNIIRWCDGLDLRMRPSAEVSSTSPSRWEELVVRYRAGQVSGGSVHGFQSSSRTSRKTEREQENDTTYECEDREEMVYNEGSMYNYTNESRQQYSQGRWRPFQLNSSSQRTRSPDAKEDKSEKAKRDKKIHILKVVFLILVNAILLIKIVDLIESRVASGPPSQWPKEMEAYPGGSININDPSPVTAGSTENQPQPNIEQRNGETNPESNNWHHDQDINHRHEGERHRRGGHHRDHKNHNEKRDWEPEGAI